MKTTIVPAQVTTVEDKIAGSLSLTQLLLLVAPIFVGGVIYAVVPPLLRLVAWKLLLIVPIALLFGAMAIRIKGKLLLDWTIIIVQYRLRPGLYLFDKNDQYHRRSDSFIEAEPDDEPISQPTEGIKLPALPVMTARELVRVEALIANPAANLRFAAAKKGGLNVHITEVK